MCPHLVRVLDASLNLKKGNMYSQSIEFITDKSIYPENVILPDTVGVRTTFSTQGREVVVLGNDQDAMTEAVRVLYEFIANHGGVEETSVVNENPTAKTDGYRYFIKLIPHGMISLALPEVV